MKKSEVIYKAQHAMLSLHPVDTEEERETLIEIMAFLNDARSSELYLEKCKAEKEAKENAETL